MLLSVSPEQVKQIIPDANSEKAAKKLAKIKDWNNISGSDDQWIWGEITGSAIYQSAVFLPELKCECSCPSFKRPCKHALALLWVYAENQDQFSIQADENAIPERVQKWREKKSKSVEKKEKAADKPVDEEARAKRQQAREKKMQDGIETLQIWLNDVADMGLARLRQQRNDQFKEISSRLVDAQAAGLNSYIDELSSALYQQDWQRLSAFWLAKLQLAVNLWQNRTQLPEGLQEEIKQLFGVNLASDAWDKIPNQTLNVYALGQITAALNSGKGSYRRQWLWDAEKLQDYLLLDFEISPYTSFGMTLPYQRQIPLNAKFYPVASQQRIRVDDFTVLNGLEMTKVSPQGLGGFAELLIRYAEGLKLNPLQSVRFFWLNDLRLVKHEKNIYLIDQQQQMIGLEPKKINFTELWYLVAHEHFDAGVEWDGLNLRLISIAQGGHFECLTH